MSHTATPHRRTVTSRTATVAGALLLVLVVLFYAIQTTMEVRGLRDDLDRAQAQTLIARASAATERQDTLERLTTLQADLDDARAEVASLREQLIAAGINPVTPSSLQAGPGAPTSELDAPESPTDVPSAPAPAQQAPEPAPAPAVPVPPVAPTPAPAPPRGIITGDDPLVCILTLCI